MHWREQAQKFVAQMTLEEKASLCSGEDFWRLKCVPRVGLTENILVTDGPHGLRKQTAGADQLGINDSVQATCFPTACATACSFDRALMQRLGGAIGEECRQEAVAVVLGPGVNIKRSPLCGRNFEYFSEDPLLAGELAAGFIEGVQAHHVGASIKHFAANNQETRRMTTESVVDERALREIYLAAFEIAVKKARPWTVMCSYNKLRGMYASDSHWLLTEVLRNEWGFSGLVVSDWGATNDRVAGVHAGMDLEMPATSRANDHAVAQAVRDGSLAEADLDACAERVVALILRARERQSMTYSIDAHRELAREAAAASAVLLKNEDALLPLCETAHIAVIGALAETPRYQGAGSSRINPHRVDSTTEELKKAGVAFAYAAGYDLDAEEPNEALIEAACEAAAGKDAVVLFAGLPERWESEGFDRTNLDIPACQNELIKRVAAVNPNTVVVLQCGSVVACPWGDSVKAILLSYLGGEATCGAAVDLLLGRRNPCGKLAETWCSDLSDTPCHTYFPGYLRSVEYRESVFVGYRYYDTADAAVRYPFGYGLSYTTFAYANLSLSQTSMLDADTLTVSFDVTNTGARAGSEIVQLYVAPRTDGIFRPAQELRAFDKVELMPKQTKRVTMQLDRRAFAYYNADARAWAVESGAYEIRIAASSRDIRLSESLMVTAVQPVAAPDYRKTAPCYYDIAANIHEIPDEAFAALYGEPLPAREMQPDQAHTVNSTMREIRNRWLGRLLAGVTAKQAKDLFGKDTNMRLMVEAMLIDAPLRMLLMSGMAAITPRRLEGLVDLLNHRVIRGLRKLIRKA